jgi:hypothetical protein
VTRALYTSPPPPVKSGAVVAAGYRAHSEPISLSLMARKFDRERFCGIGTDKSLATVYGVPLWTKRRLRELVPLVPLPRRVTLETSCRLTESSLSDCGT